VGRIAFLTDRPPTEALPSLHALGHDVKTGPLEVDSLLHLADMAPAAVVVDAEADADRAYGLLRTLAASGSGLPTVVLCGRQDLERFPWHEVADELVLPGTGPQELRIRLEMVLRRTGGAGDAVIRLGPLAMNTETYQVTVAGRVLDLTYKEFELLRFLIQRPGRVCTRSQLLSEVWGYDFYGGTRTVDVHIRRLRAKLGPEHEGLIETVRGVGYRAAEPGGAAPGA
jgi:DNA-binding response OmpR family regulator